MRTAGRLLAIRADASDKIGVGHVMRCLALAQAWRERGGEVVFVFCACPSAVLKRFRQEGVRTLEIPAERGSSEDVRQTLRLAEAHGAAWLALDGYAFGTAYQNGLMDRRFKVLLLDDYGHAKRYVCDLVLNQNVYAIPSIYMDRAEHTRLLLGPRYALLRREFLTPGDWRRRIEDEPSRVLITLGGSDERGLTTRVVEAIRCAGVPGLQITALVGASFSPGHRVRRGAAQMPDIRIRRNVDDVAEWMRWADVGVTAGGSTCYEAAHLGLPCLVAVVTDHQCAVAKAFAGEGVVDWFDARETFPLEDCATKFAALLANPSRRRDMTAAGQGLVPADGASAVVRVMVGDEC